MRTMVFLALSALACTGHADQIYDVSFSGIDGDYAAPIVVTGYIDLKSGSKGELTPSDIKSWEFTAASAGFYSSGSGTSETCETQNCGMAIKHGQLIIDILPQMPINSNYPVQGIFFNPGFYFNFNALTQGVEGEGLIIYPSGPNVISHTTYGEFSIDDGTVIATRATKTVHAPELDASSGFAAFSLLAGMVAVIRGHLKGETVKCIPKTMKCWREDRS